MLDQVLRDYGLLWCLHQFSPFLDKALPGLVIGEAGAVDARAISSLDWAVRLPLVVLALIRPTPRTLVVAHAINLVSWLLWMPQCWDHMCWAATMEFTFIACMLLGKSQLCLPALRTQMVCLYLCAAFWKLTSSFLDHRTSCATVLFAELAATVVPESLMPAGSRLAEMYLRAAPPITVATELVIGPLLALVPRYGVPFGLLFHFVINCLPLNYAGGFSLMCAVRYGIFLPDGVRGALAECAKLGGWTAVHAAAAAVGGAASLYFQQARPVPTSASPFGSDRARRSRAACCHTGRSCPAPPPGRGSTATLRGSWRSRRSSSAPRGCSRSRRPPPARRLAGWRRRRPARCATGYWVRSSASKT